MKKNLVTYMLLTAMLTLGVISSFAATYGRVLAFSTNEYTMVFRAGESTRVMLDGDGDTDLDLYVYDQFGNMVAWDTDYTDYCIARLTVMQTGVFTIRIVNRGDVYNDYKLIIN